MDLSVLQHAFLAHIDGHSNQIVDWVKSQRGVDAVTRLAIYRHSAKGNLVEALKGAYPVVNKLIGNDCFEEVCLKFIDVHTHHSPDICLFGNGFDTFLISCPVLAHLDYLPDVARLEWAVHIARDATEQCTLNISALQSLPEDAQMGLVFALPSAGSLLRSAYPIKKIWHVNQPDFTGDNSVNLSDGGECLLVHLHRYELKIDMLSELHFAMLDLFAQQQPFAEVLATLMQQYAPKTITECFAECISNGWLTKFS